MKAIPIHGSNDFFMMSLAVEEAVILFQPGEMLRATCDRYPSCMSGARFLTRTDAGGPGGMLALFPKSVALLLLSAVSGHAVERELQKNIFGILSPADRPRLRPECNT